MKTITQLTAATLLLCNPLLLLGEQVQLQNATATFSQTTQGHYSVTNVIDGIKDERQGWAISPAPGSTIIGPQTVVFEAVADVGFTNATRLTFTLSQLHTSSAYGLDEAHNLGRLRLSLTTDSRSDFADGLETGGDVTANWAVLDPFSFISVRGTTLTELPDHSILASGPNPSTDIYIVSCIVTNTGITGFRLEALEDPSLPQGGPGRRPENGNFVLTEFEVDATSFVSSNVASIYGSAEICWLSEPAKQYQVQFTSDVDSGEWHNFGQPIQGNGNEICVFDSTRGRQKRFYRVQILP
ncbi:MAG: hypothetical protein WCL11_16930 [Verrucomicrobiota bacterium]